MALNTSIAAFIDKHAIQTEEHINVISRLVL